MAKTSTAAKMPREAMTPRPERSRKSSPTAKRPGTAEARTRTRPSREIRPPVATTSKQQRSLDMLRRANGASIEELQAATGWQAHNVRGFLSGTVRKKLALELTSVRSAGAARRYHLEPEASCSGAGRPFRSGCAKAARINEFVHL